MKRESVFRSITAALLVTAAAISVYHRHRAEQAGGEEISLQEEGLPTALALRSSGLVLMLSVVAYLLNPRWMRWSSLDLPPFCAGRAQGSELCSWSSRFGSFAPSART
jgi:hypothetical protein